MRLQLFGCMFNLLFPPRASAEDEQLVQAIDRHTAAAQVVARKASDIERALANIQDAGEGLFA